MMGLGTVPIASLETRLSKQQHFTRAAGLSVQGSAEGSAAPGGSRLTLTSGQC